MEIRDGKTCHEGGGSLCFDVSLSITTEGEKSIGQGNRAVASKTTVLIPCETRVKEKEKEKK